MFEDNIFAAIADGTLLDTFLSAPLRLAIPGSITARNAQGHNYLEAALWIRTRTWQELNSELARQRRWSKEQEKWYRDELEGDAEGVHKKSEEIVRYLLAEHPALLNQQDDAGITPLMRFSTYQPASYTGGSRQVEVVPLLLQYKPQGDLQDKQGRTALHYAAEKGTVAVVDQLCKAFPSIINVQTREGHAALHLAAQNNTIDEKTRICKVAMFMAAQASVDIVDKNGQWPLHDYVLTHMRSTDHSRRPKLPGRPAEPLDFYDLLHGSIMAIVKQLCDASYSVLGYKNRFEQTPLHIAFNQLTSEPNQAARAHFLALCTLYCQHEHAHVVMSLAEQSSGRLFLYLFAHPANRNLGRTFQIAEEDPVYHLDIIMRKLAQIDSHKLMSLLRQAKDEAGRTRIHHIAQKRMMDFLRQYDSELLDVNAVDNDGNTPLHVLLTKDIEDIKAAATHEYFAYLCELGAKINLQNQMGATPLHLAAGHGVLSHTKTLLRYGADLSIQDQAGRTPIHMNIRARQRIDIIDVAGERQYHVKPFSARLLSYLALLLRHVSDETMCLQDKQGRTVLHEAIMAGDVGAITCLLIRCPQLLDIKDGEGHTPLELAQMQQRELLTRIYYGCVHRGDMVDEGGKLINELRLDSERVPEYLATQAQVKTSPQLVKDRNAQIKTYAHGQDMIFLERLSTLGPKKPSQPQPPMIWRKRSPDEYAEYHRCLKQYPTSLEQYHTRKAAFEQTKTELFADSVELFQIDNLNTDSVQAFSCAATESTSTAPGLPSSSMTPESPSSILSDSVSSAPQDGVKDSLSVTFMPPPPQSFSTSLPFLSSSQPSCSYDITRGP